MDNKYIGILTSGGDASGMNAAIRAVTRAAIFNGFKVKGIYRGYEGLIAGEVKELTTEDVSSIIQRGGTILKTARSETFTTPEGRKKAYKVIQKENINALIIIGGDGSLTGARIFAEEYDVTCIGLPGTIDNDLYGTDFTIGYDTALNTIVECVDKIRDTATSHDRIFFVEVMGRDAGFLAQNSAIASGAEAAIIPEDRTDVDQLETFIGRGFRKTKNSSIVIVTESPENKNGGAIYYADRVKKEYPGYDVRVSILGHLQRGGAPSANDRILASRLAEATGHIGLHCSRYYGGSFRFSGPDCFRSCQYQNMGGHRCHFSAVRDGTGLFVQEIDKCGHYGYRCHCHYCMWHDVHRLYSGECNGVLPHEQYFSGWNVVHVVHGHRIQGLQ